MGNKRKIPPDIWRKHVIWVWQLTPDRIKFEDDTYKKIELFVNELHDMFSESRTKPLTNELFNVFERMTVANAALRHSVDKHDNLIVKPEHAEYVKEKYLEYIKHLELEKVMVAEKILPLDRLESLLGKVIDTNKGKILLYIGNQPRCRQIDISNSLKMDKGNVSTNLNWFQENHLIKDRTKIRLTDIGAELYRKLLEYLEARGKVVTTNSTTNKNDEKDKEKGNRDSLVVKKVVTTNGKTSQHDKIIKLVNFVEREKEAGRKIWYESLTSRFSKGFIDNCIKREILIKLPDESYDIKN